MISVVVCSVNPQLAAQIKRNLEETAGAEWELILIDNNALKLGICDAYNLGAERAKFNLLCFVHEDVLFKTAEWANRVVEYFHDDPTLGLLGIAGSKYKSKTPSGWATGLAAFDCCNILHRNQQQHEERFFANPDPASSVQSVVTIDGVFMVVRKEVWQSNRFNGQLLPGFHVYDIDFSFRIASNYKVLVVFDIDLIHLTEGGNYGNEWLDHTLKWHGVNRHHLPRMVSHTEDSRTADEVLISKKWLHRLRDERISLLRRFRWLRAAHALRIPFLWPHIAVFLGFRLFRRMIP